MGMLKEFYTIREVSSLTGFTVQSVYSRLEKAEKDTGKSYCTIGEDKVKRVSADFLRDCYGITGEEEEEARKLDIVARLESELDRERVRIVVEEGIGCVVPLDATHLVAFHEYLLEVGHPCARG